MRERIAKSFVTSIGGALADVKVERTEVVQVSLVDTALGYATELNARSIR